MKTFRYFNEIAQDALNPLFPYGGSSAGPGMGQYEPIADLNADEKKEVKKSDLDQIEKYADRIFAAVGIDVEFTRHFLDRVNDARNVKQITPSELTRLFKQTFKKYGKKISKLGDDAQAVINDMKTNINMPFVLNKTKGGELELVAKTVMRKKNFSTSSQKLSFENYSKEPRLDEKYKADVHYQYMTYQQGRRKHYVASGEGDTKKQAIDKAMKIYKSDRNVKRGHNAEVDKVVTKKI